MSNEGWYLVFIKACSDRDEFATTIQDVKINFEGLTISSICSHIYYWSKGQETPHVANSKPIDKDDWIPYYISYNSAVWKTGGTPAGFYYINIQNN